jgi:hypothetical protein
MQKKAAMDADELQIEVVNSQGQLTIAISAAYM